MIVNKDCLHALAELTISRLIVDGTQSAWSDNYQINLLKDNIDILIDVKLKEINSHGVSLVLVYQNKIHLADIVIKDCRMFYRNDLKDDLSKWHETTHEMLVHNYSRWLTNHLMETDLYIKDWFCKLKTRVIPASITISDHLFKANLYPNAAWFQVEHGKTIVYRIERSNYLNMTTKQGWQSLGATGIRSELLRVLSTLLTTDDEFNFPVSL